MDEFLGRFYEQVRTRPNQIAFEDHNNSITYQELNALSSAMARRLQQQEVAPNDVLACLKTSMRTAIVTALAAAKTGCIFVSQDARDSHARLKHVFTPAEPKLVLADSSVGIAKADHLDIPVTDIATLKADRADMSVPDVASDVPYWLEPTSGSTGAPKLVQSSRATVQHLIFAQAECAGFTSEDRIALFGELWSDTLMAGLTCGATYVSYDLREKGTAPLPEWMKENRITAVQTFVAAFRGLADACTAPLPDLKTVRVAGEVVLRRDVELFEKITAAGARFMNFYGSTECGLISQFVHQHGNDIAHDILPIGREIPGSSIQLLDELKRPVPDGIPGLMILRTRHLADGYFKNPEKSKSTYWTEVDGTRVLNTGDVALRDEEGLLHIVGRADDQVKVRGFSVRYSEIEEVLQKHPTVQDVLVTSFLSPRGQRQLSAHVIPSGAHKIDAKAMKAWLAEQLPSYMVPTYFVSHDVFPLTETGKPMRRGLPNPLEMKENNTQDQSFANETERAVAASWQEILGHSAFGLEEDFFDCGGDSLQAMSMVVALEQRLLVRIGYESLVMKGATVRDIAARIDAARSDSSGIITLKKGTARMPIYVLPVENGEFSNWLYMLRQFDDEMPLLGVHVRDQTVRTAFPRVSQRDLARHAARNIVAHDPNGPYLVAGYSAGTQTAFETARILKEQGHVVAGLLLLDPPVAQLEDYRKTWHIRRIVSPLIKNLDLRKAAQRMSHILFGTPTSELHIADETTFWRYRPEPCALDNVMLVSARDFNPDKANKETEWRRLVGGSPEIVDAPGTHNLLLRDPNAAVVARIIQNWWMERHAQSARPTATLYDFPAQADPDHPLKADAQA